MTTPTHAAADQAARRGELERARLALYVALTGRAPRRVVDRLLARVARLRADCLAEGVPL